MVSVSSPNWLIILGLTCVLYGLFLLGSAVVSDGARWTGQHRLGAGLRGYQHVALTVAMCLLAIGFFVLMVGQFAVFGMTAPIALAMLALAFGLLIFALVADLIGARIDDRLARTSVAGLAPAAPSAEIHEIDPRPAAERLRIAS